ncbi:T cell receptor beta chain MC.7.G5-like [Melanotaenia boesemani]|uniref:T cell receptor beta chain MC.7.G5-like n=1 Tax=Melanotaenia boesemani TaxID=1250792 RepID=UPI001C04D587|nr:T cell receptor beta chain MC.7.G5-like [Melanotaenia boesemani]
MLFLPAALCWLCSALVAMAAELIQDQLSKTTRADATISLKCTGTNQCDKKQVYWYQQKEGDSLQTILRVDLNDGTVNKRYGHSQRDDFEAMITADLVIKQVKFEHAATYYCSCYKSACFTVGGSDDSKNYLIFGTGTKLFVTDKPVRKPKVIVYKAASKGDQEKKNFLLCQASGMNPPFVQFSWERQKEDGSLEELLPAEGDQLEIKESASITAIRVVDRDPHYTYKYICYVKHEGTKVEAQTHQVVSAHPPPPPATGWFRERLLSLLYTLLIAKSVVCCWGLSLSGICRK